VWTFLLALFLEENLILLFFLPDPDPFRAHAGDAVVMWDKTYDTCTRTNIYTQIDPPRRRSTRRLYPPGCREPIQTTVHSLAMERYYITRPPLTPPIPGAGAASTRFDLPLPLPWQS
jgi:hypothetical protein